MALPVWLPTQAGEDDAFLAHLQRLLDPDAVRLHAGAEAPAGGETRVLVRGAPDDAMLAACPALTHLLIPYAGLPRATAGRLAGKPGIAVHNLHHNAAATAELAVALLLACAKEIVPYDRDLRAGDWRRRYTEPTTMTLAGARALVLGYGAIGRRVARTLAALGMRVTALRRSARSAGPEDGIPVAPIDALGAELPRADAVLVCLPWTVETDGLLDAAALGRMAPGAYLVNVGRGAIVDEEALYRALAEQRLAGAGLDVWYRYPSAEDERRDTPPARFPFGALENVVLSPHRAGQTRQTEEARARGVADLLHAIAAGEDVPNRVDLARGY